MAPNYLFDLSTKSLPSEHFGKEPNAVFLHRHKKEQNYSPEKPSSFVFENSTPEKEISSQPNRDEMDELNETLNADQQYDNNIKTEQTKQRPENVTQIYSQYSSSNRKPITFDTRPIAYLQEENDFLGINRPFFQRSEEKSFSKPIDIQSKRNINEKSNEINQDFLTLNQYSNATKGIQNGEESAVSVQLTDATLEEESSTSFSINENTDKDEAATLTPTVEGR